MTGNTHHYIEDDDFEYVASCPACGSPIDYCQGHGELGDPAGFAILAAHDDGDHRECHPDGCDDAPTADVDPAPWRAEFGEEYAVPSIIVELGDHSWHNDAAPSFGTYTTTRDLRVWAQHPDPQKREWNPGGRYFVLDGEDTVYVGDDATAAVSAYREALAVES